MTVTIAVEMFPKEIFLLNKSDGSISETLKYSFGSSRSSSVIASDTVVFQTPGLILTATILEL